MHDCMPEYVLDSDVLVRLRPFERIAVMLVLP